LSPPYWKHRFDTKVSSLFYLE